MQADDGKAGKATLDELSALFPQPRTVTVAGRKVEIVPSSIRAGASVLHLALALWALRESDDDDELILADEHPTEAAALLVAATGFDPVWIAGLSASDKCELALAWMEVNGAFFVLRPMLVRARMQKAVASMLGAGAASSTPSPVTDISTLAASRHRVRNPPSSKSSETNAVAGASA